MKCGAETEVYSRVCGYHRPVKNWNRGKREEFKQRKPYNLEKSSKEHTHGFEHLDVKEAV